MFDIVNIFLFLFAMFFAIGAYRLGIGSVTKPGPGFIIFFAAIILLLFSVYGFYSGKESKPLRLAFSIKGLKRVLLVIISLVLYTKFMPLVGYLLSTFVLTWFLLVLNGIKIHKALVLSVLISLLSWYGFSRLGSELPEGFISFLR
jgi:putative tricarboxylic transport membrane protein